MSLNLHHNRIPELVEGLLAFFVQAPQRAKKKGSPSTSSGIRRALADSVMSLPALAFGAANILVSLIPLWLYFKLPEYQRSA
jgi:hypothetical protein